MKTASRTVILEKINGDTLHRFVIVYCFVFNIISWQTALVQIIHGGKPVIITDRHAGVDPDAVRASLQEKATKVRID